MRSSLVRGGLGVGDRKKVDNDDQVQKTLNLRKQQHLRISQKNHRSPYKNNKLPPSIQYKRPDGLELPYGTIPYFLGAALVVIVSAIFMHLIASSNHQHAERRRQAMMIKRKKPKTDEYNEDARVEDDLLSDSNRKNGRIYYPNDNVLHRHRCKPPTSTTTTTTTTTTNAGVPTAVTATARPSSYYLNPSGTVVTPYSPAPPSSHRYHPPSPVPTPDRITAMPLSTTASSFASLTNAATSEDADEERPHTPIQYTTTEGTTPNRSFRLHEQGTPRIANTVELVPFVPSLRLAEQRPPKSVNLHELHLFRTPSETLKEAVFDTADELYDKIPSGDPHNAIQHLRPDLTKHTDSSGSLQLAIDFNEIKLVEVIGGGGFGQVWKGVWKGTPVAVKVLTGSAQSRNVPRSILEEFAAEINLLRGMRHPNISLLIGACLEPPNRAIITELALFGSLWDALRLPLQSPHTPCDGMTREGWPEELYRPDAKHGVPPGAKWVNPHVPQKGAWKWNLVHRVALGAARGMAYLHGGKPPILHRDLKSANILLDESYTAKVCDFGLSRIKSQGQSMTGNCGTVQWMAPEVLANQAYNEKADIYSYGIIFWELLSQQCPFDKMTPIQCALAVLNRNQRPEIPKWCPPPLQALIRSCLKRDPDERPTFEQIIDSLDRMLPPS